jgi:hypothetical protein
MVAGGFNWGGSTTKLRHTHILTNKAKMSFGIRELDGQTLSAHKDSNKPSLLFDNAKSRLASERKSDQSL